jgi:hypothetical protein
VAVVGPFREPDLRDQPRFFDALLKCVNHLPMAEVIANYWKHVGFRDEAHPGGYRESDVEILRTFECGGAD